MKRWTIEHLKISLVIILSNISLIYLFLLFECASALADDKISPRSLTITRIMSFRYRLAAYYRIHKQLPKYLKDLPIEPDRDGSTKDGWNRELGYHYNEKNIVTLWSLGRDGLPGGENEDMDIVESFQFYEGMKGNNEDGRTLRREGEVLKPDWGKLEFIFPLEDERTITQIDIELYINIFSERKISVTDKSQLIFIRKSLTTPLRIASKNYNRGWRDNPIGKITVVTNQDRFIIGINPSGFSLESNTSDIQNVFFSYSLAQYINEIFYKETKKYISSTIIDNLSGEDRIKSEKKIWDEWKAKNITGVTKDKMEK